MKPGLSLTGTQLRAARGLLNMSVAELAARTKLAINTIRRAEATNDSARITEANAEIIRTVLEREGVVLIEADHQLGAGARLRDITPGPPRSRRRS